MKILPYKKTSPVRKSAVIIEPRALPSLGACLLMDFLGMATFAVPVLGEFLDLFWAPVSALIYMKMFGFRKGFFGGMFNFMEELLPGFDFIPTFTITWFIQYFKRNKEAVSLRPFTR